MTTITTVLAHFITTDLRTAIANTIAAVNHELHQNGIVPLPAMTNSLSSVRSWTVFTLNAVNDALLAGTTSDPEEIDTLIDLQKYLTREMETIDISDEVGIGKNFSRNRLSPLEYGDVTAVSSQNPRELPPGADDVVSDDEINDFSDEVSIEAGFQMMDPDLSVSNADKGTFAQVLDGEAYEGLLNADSKLFRIVELDADETNDLAHQLKSLTEGVSKTDLLRLMSLRPYALREELLNSGRWECTAEEADKFIRVCWGRRMFPTENWSHLRGGDLDNGKRGGIALAHERLAEKIAYDIEKATSIQQLRSIRGRLGLLMAVSIAAGKGQTKLPDGKPFPKGDEHIGLPFRYAARLQNDAALKAGKLVAPKADWAKRAAQLTYKITEKRDMGEMTPEQLKAYQEAQKAASEDRARAEKLATALSAWLSEHVAKGLSVKAIGVYPEKVSSDEGDAFEHMARQGSFLAEEAETPIFVCPLCKGTGWYHDAICYPCGGYGEGDQVVIMSRIADMRVFQLKEEQETDDRVDIISVRTPTSDVLAWQAKAKTIEDWPHVDVNGIAKEPKPAIITVKDGVVKRDRAVLSTPEELPRLVGWETIGDLIGSHINLAQVPERSDRPQAPETYIVRPTKDVFAYSRQAA